MAEPELTLAAQYLRQVVEVLRSMGVDPADWLAPHGLGEARLEEASLTMSLPTFGRLLMDAERVAREPALGLFVGERLGARTHGFVGAAALHSQTLREVLEVFVRFLGVRISVLAVVHSVEGPDLHVELAELVPLGEAQRPVLEAVVMSVRNVVEAVSMGACPVKRVAFPFPAPDYAALARDLIGCEVAYGAARARLTLPSALLDQPLRMADPRAFEEAAELCQRQLDALGTTHTTAGRVRRLLLEKQNGFPSLQTTARRLHVTPRTLHRRLDDEGTSFRSILEDVRQRLAEDHLRAGRASVEEIAYMLGYSDPANFRRAFRRWTSVSPSAFRAAARES
ncbi:MAG: AraC family transcriptional regulator [Myxococcales bacterium]|nr:AraC family transcriptional regulator [Myxococcales bacterium]